MKYRIKATNEIIELRTWRRDDGAIKLVDKYGKMGFWPDEVEPAEHLGWHPASELPKLKDGEDDVEFIVILDGYGIRLPFHATYCKYTGWSHDNVKWWCYPPKEE